MNDKEIEFWEHQYLEQISYLLEIDKDKMMDGFSTKEDIRANWEEFLGKETSDFSTGSERIFYWLFSQFGKPNSSPIGSDMFFETYNAYVHIDIKTVTKGNIGDISRNIFVGDNQNSYIGTIHVKNNPDREYRGNLPTIYKKTDGSEKVCLSYFICILYDENAANIETIFVSCMPNGELAKYYEPNVLKAGKNPGKIRFSYSSCKYFELLDEKPLRTKILVWEPDHDVESKLPVLKDIYYEQMNK